ncbi:hypothetical protein [Mesorhizobium sp. IMUNJ 23232]|uniref:hypothetical protein n=1 Tax=Mesorhizobium sp. IMUNJ 23232 TaxID=3376064 RepID=UPI0037A6D49F
MLEGLQPLLGLVLAGALGLVLLRQFQRNRAAAAASRGRLFGEVANLLAEPNFQAMPEPDHPILHGRFRGLPVQLRAVVDTLATRKLPSLWLMVTVPVPTGVGAVFDFMMRPASASTFSNYDQLPHIISAPAGWPPDGIARSDNPLPLPAAERLEPALKLLGNARAKEFLVTPQGVRFVVQLAEADRARYGVFRQAEFGDVVVSKPFLAEVLTGMAEVIDNLRAERKAA